MTNAVRFLGPPHIGALVLTVCIPIVLVWVVRKAHSPKMERTIRYGLAAVLLTNEIAHWGYRLLTVPEFGEILRKYLSIHICGVTVFAVTFALFFRHQILYEIAYFWGLVGALNAVLTPQIEFDYPHYRFFQYFIAHSGIVIGIVFATLGLGMRPSFRAIFRAFLILNVYAALIALVNLLLGSNYMFLCEPPDTASPFFFAPWPWYILILEAVTLLFFFVVYTPFFVTARFKFRRQGVEDVGENRIGA